MNIEINLLPDELRPRPPVETSTLLVIVLVIALAAGCGFLIQAKNSASTEAEQMRGSIVTINQEISAISNDAEVVALNKSISRLKQTKAAYDGFKASRIEWGDALEKIKDYVPTGVEVDGMKQSGNTVVVEGVASGYLAVSSYGRALDRDSILTLGGMPSMTSSDYSLIVKVAPGGAG